MSWAWCQNYPIDVNFHLQKRLKILEKNSADKILFKKDTGIKVSPSVPNRVKEEKLWENDQPNSLDFGIDSTNVLFIFWTNLLDCRYFFLIFF